MAALLPCVSLPCAPPLFDGAAERYQPLAHERSASVAGGMMYESPALRDPGS